MPTYEYTCKGCGETIEVFQSFSEKPLRWHPDGIWGQFNHAVG